jgi:hypothetical protein
MNITAIKQHYNVEPAGTYAGMPVYTVAERLTEDERHCESCTCSVESDHSNQETEDETRNMQSGTHTHTGNDLLALTPEQEGRE